VADGGRALCLEQAAPVAQDTGPYAGLPPHYLLDFVPRARFRLIREYPSHNISFYEFDDTVHILRRDHPVFSGIAPGKFARWNGNQALISSYLQGPNPPDPVPPENQTAIRTEGTKRRPLYEIDSGESVFILAACYTGWQDVAVAEVRYGAGCYFFSQIEAVRRYNQDPVATRYLHNLLNYTMNRNS